MLLAVPVIVATMACSEAKKRAHEGRSNSYTLSQDCSSFQFVGGVSVEYKMTEELKSIAGVGGVHISRNGSSLSIQVDVLTFDRATRHMIYAKERELRKEYPAIGIEMHLADITRASENA